MQAGIQRKETARNVTVAKFIKRASKGTMLVVSKSTEEASAILVKKYVEMNASTEKIAAVTVTYRYFNIVSANTVLKRAVNSFRVGWFMLFA